MSISCSSYYIKSGNVYACGNNTNGQLGLNDTTNRTSPTLIPNLSNVKQVSCGQLHVIFLLNDGNVYACGNNADYQLGLNDTTNRKIPTKINITNVKQIACGGAHTIFLKEDGTVYECGDNAYGQLGLNDTTNRLIPTLISSLSNVKQIACGANHTVFLLNDGTVKVCGQNSNGQLGLNNTTVTLVPTLIPNLINVKQVTCGQNHTIFLLNDGTTYGCGDNYYWELGLGNNTNILSPTKLNITNVKQIACGSDQTLFLLNDGTVKGSGVIFGSNGTVYKTITLISNLTNVIQVMGGDRFSLFLLSNGSVKCCGDNSDGRLGLGNTTAQLSIVTNSKLSNIELLFDITLPIIKYLIYQNNLYYSLLQNYYDSTTHNFNLLTLSGGATPNNSDYINFGFNNFAQLTSSITYNTDTFIPDNKLNLGYKVYKYEDGVIALVYTKTGHKILIQDNDRIKTTTDGVNLIDLGTSYNQETFNEYGMNDLSLLNPIVIGKIMNNEYKILMYKII